MLVKQYHKIPVHPSDSLSLRKARWRSDVFW